MISDLLYLFGMMGAVVVASFLLAWYGNRTEHQTWQKNQRLARRLWHARVARLQRLKEHTHFDSDIRKLFCEPDYQWLWRRELDAEEAMNICCGTHSWTSWDEYRAEAEACGNTF